MIPVMSLSVFGLAIFLLIIGAPVVVAIGFSSILVLLFFQPVPLVAIPQLMFSGMESYVLVAIPLFVLAGVLMESGGIAKKLISFSKGLVGWSKGGLGAVNVFSSFIFGGISGSSIADTVAIGSVMIPEMVEDGYDKDYSAAITVISSTLAVVVPPSVLMIILGALSEQSVSRLLIGGLIPGAFMAIAMMVQNYIISKKHGYGTVTKFSFTYLWKTFKQGILALGTPLIILIGIMTGFVTPTESGALAVFYTLIISAFFYKTLNLKVLRQSMITGSKMTASVVAIVAVSSVFTFILTYEGLPQLVATFLTNISQNKIVILLLINVFLLIVGTIIDASVAIVILVPILFPVALNLGIHPIHFGVLFVINLAIGLVTPPFGVCLFSVCSIAKIEMGPLIKSTFPLYTSLIVVLLSTTVFPEIVLFLPRLIFGE
jgi:C4-dicarboxylate transporter DctM subunit